MSSVLIAPVSGRSVRGGLAAGRDRRVDVRAGDVSGGAAADVYGVVLDGAGGPDAAATSARRDALLSEHRSWSRGEPTERDAPRTPATGEPDRLVHEYVRASDRNGARILACTECGTALCDDAGSYKAGALCNEGPVTRIPSAPDPAAYLDDAMVFRRYACPGCFVQIATDVARAGEPIFPEMRLIGQTR